MELPAASSATRKPIRVEIHAPQRSFTPRLKQQATFLELSYSELEERNLKIKADVAAGKTDEELAPPLKEALKSEAGIKAVTVCFTDLEGKFHMLDYNKNFLLKADDNLTFDGCVGFHFGSFLSLEEYYH